MSEFSGSDLTCIRGERYIFSQLNFDIKSGEILHLKGPNGSGKSTLLRLMSGLAQPTKGSISWAGENIKNDQDHFCQNVHYVGHLDALNSALTVSENLIFWTKMKNINIGESCIKKVLEIFSLNHLSNFPTRLLSSGQRKRLNLSRICAIDAPLWLLDEPSNSLDTESLYTLNKIISEHQKRGGIAVIATHDILDLNCRVLDIENFHNFEPIHQEFWR